MRRKLVAVMLAVMVLSTSLAGCGGSNTDQKESKKTQTTTVDKKSTDMKDESKEDVKEDKKVVSETTKEKETSKKSDSVKEESKKEESKKEESKKDESKKSDSKENASKKSNSKKDTSTKTTKTTSSSSNKKQETTKPSTSTTKPSTSKPSSSTNNKGNSSQTETKPAHQHNYVAQTHTVHHDATGHNEQYVVQAAYDEQVTTYENYAWDCCNVCGADCTADPGGHAYQHAIKGEGGGHHTEYGTRPVTKTVHHDAVYGTKWVQDSAAYDETVVDGYVCSCGARK